MPLGISRICQAIAPSATFAMDAKARALRAAGESVVSFAAGEPDFDTPEPIRDAMKDALDRGMTRYSPVTGTLELRDAIAQKLSRDNGLEYARDEIIVSGGAKHSLFTIFQTILDPGDEVIVPAPCWVSYPEMVRMAGGLPVLVYASEGEGFIPAMERIAAAVTPRTKAFILTSPNNPNGCVWPEETLRALAAL
ncbi:MAG: aminotransferase class I/II-fold pyridoxal phosphate-dependent enzyme, partial [Eubacteriales bacterium]|nr:aminotransferase class I/II-fold pyridoxal phosphate-dependent enzyme [Eubacteriales bacterium]